MPSLATCATHRFCRSCWQTYIVTAVAGGIGCLSLRCPEPSCHAAVEDNKILAVLIPEGGKVSAFPDDMKDLDMAGPSDRGGQSSGTEGKDKDGAHEPLSLPVAAEHFNRYRMRSYVELNEQVKWCPAANCMYAIGVDHEGGSARGLGAATTVSRDVQCKCGHEWCWNCQEEPHKPVQCDLVRKWVAKNR